MYPWTTDRTQVTSICREWQHPTSYRNIGYPVPHRRIMSSLNYPKTVTTMLWCDQSCAPRWTRTRTNSQLVTNALRHHCPKKYTRKNRPYLNHIKIHSGSVYRGFKNLRNPNHQSRSRFQCVEQPTNPWILQNPREVSSYTTRSRKCWVNPRGCFHSGVFVLCRGVRMNRNQLALHRPTCPVIIRE